MTLTVNLSQINAAAKGNNDLRETLTSIHLALQAVYQQTGSGPLKKVDATANKNLGPPAQCGFSVTGANGVFTYQITLPQQAGGSSAPGNPTNAALYHEISSSPTANFASNVTTYPVTTATSGSFANPGASLTWRLRSSYDQKTWNNYQVQSGVVNAGLQSSAASEPATVLNQTNFARIDSIGAGASATIRVYGPGGVGTAWTYGAGTNTKVIPGGTILNVTYGSTAYVAWTGTQYQVRPNLAQVLPDSWIPVGSCSVIANGSGLVLPVIHAVVTSGAIVAYQIINAGNGMTAPPTLTITDSTGSGATATAVVAAGAVTQVIPGSAGSGYSSSPTVTPAGGVSGGVAGGGGATGNNGGRLFGLTTNGA